MIAVGDLVKTRTGKTIWKVTALHGDRAGVCERAELTKVETDGSVAGYVNTTMPCSSLVKIG